MPLQIDLAEPKRGAAMVMYGPAVHAARRDRNARMSSLHGKNFRKGRIPLPNSLCRHVHLRAWCRVTCRRGCRICQMSTSGPRAGHVVCSIPNGAEDGGPPPDIDAAQPLGGNEMKHRTLIIYRRWRCEAAETAGS